MIKKFIMGEILLLVLFSNFALASEAELRNELDELRSIVRELQREVKGLKQENQQLKELAPLEKAPPPQAEKAEAPTEEKRQAVVVDDKFEFLENIKMGADFRVRGVYAEGADDSEYDSVSGYDQRLRVKIDYVDKSGVALRTRTYLYDNNWLGDRRAAGGAGSDICDGEDNIALDYGYIEIPFADTWKLTAGRQIANWAFNFITDDDRRDRIMLSHNFGETAIGNLTALAIYDKRQEGLLNIYKDDGDMYAIATVTQTGDWQWGLLLDYWHGYAGYESQHPDGKDGYVLDDLWSFAPFVHGKADNMEVIWALHYMNGNGRGDGVYEPGQGLWANESFATFLRLGYDFDLFKAEVQGFYLNDGALVGDGWDSFSCVIQNGPRNDPNPIRLSGVGGLGYDGDDQWLAALRFSGKVFNDRVGWSVAGGYVDTKNDDPDPRNLGKDNRYPLSEYFFDLQGSYRFMETLELYGKFGIISGDEDDGDGPGAGRYGALMGLSWNY
ncbi:hypothetical protein DENIS_0415 [Desulfonema ishimotonii]|uniref:Porin n=1 Tax=Desulfonema ishimotonii TaxID=45657 RepID=A0A401FR84_9BACT|nr:cell division protein ZapB [Desulfonema ishimotonii]GBC59476.1 hypothetical protein DENIS_0415 [Desulfonema ishimotonii]